MMMTHKELDELEITEIAADYYWLNGKNETAVFNELKSFVDNVTQTDYKNKHCMIEAYLLGKYTAKLVNQVMAKIPGVLKNAK